VYVWLNANGNKLDWMLTWLHLHPQPPRMGEQQIVMYKPGRPESLASSYQATGLPTNKKKDLLDDIKEGRPLNPAQNKPVAPIAAITIADDSDADLGDRQFMRLEWVDVRDLVNKWCLGQIVEVAEGRVLVHYEGWPSKWDEWIDVGSNRLAPASKHTTRDMWQRKKEWKPDGDAQLTSPAPAPSPSPSPSASPAPVARPGLASTGTAPAISGPARTPTPPATATVPAPAPGPASVPAAAALAAPTALAAPSPAPSHRQSAAGVAKPPTPPASPAPGARSS